MLANTSNRRRFLLSSAGAAAGCAMLPHASTGSCLIHNAATDQSNSDQEAVDWIDAHVHVWTPDVKNYPLDKSFKVTDMQPASFTPTELLQQCKPLGVNRVVLIQMSFYGLDHSYMFDAMKDHPGVFSAVALIDHRSDRVAQSALELVQRGARGFRIHSQGDAKDWPNSPTMQKLWQCAAEHGFAICPLINPQDIQYVDQLCAKNPETPVVVDHFARIGVSGKIEEDRLTELCRLARFPKVHLKTSAFYALGKKQKPYHDLKPMIKRVLNAFGPERLMWATDCPYQVQGDHTYKASVDLILDDTEILSARDKQWIMRDTAKKIFFS